MRGDFQPKGGIDRYTLPPHTIKRRTTTNFRRKNNHNCQKTELYGSPTTKELKKKHSSRLVGGAKRTHGKAAAGGPGRARRCLVDWVRRWLIDWVVPHSCADKLRGTTKERDRPHAATQGSSLRK